MFQSIEYKHPKFYQVFRIFIVILASIIFAWNLCCFARSAGLFPGSFSGLSLLLQEIFQKFLHIHVPYTLFNVILNLFPIYIGCYLFGWSIALYSIIFQFCSTQTIQLLYKRYKKETLFIISDHAEQIYRTIRETTNHDATLFQGIGCYEEKEKTLIYSVINTEAKRQLIPLIRSIDPHAFINIVKTEELAGRFHDIPND